MQRFLCFAIFCVALRAVPIAAQGYFFGSFALGLPKYDALNAVVNRFDQNQNQLLGKMDMLTGFEIGLGTYGPKTMMEAKYASIGARLNSKVPNNPIENSSVDYHYNYLNYSFGYRPFSKVYFTFGGGINVGQISTRYSFGGDWIVTNQDYAASGEVFIDYAMPLKLKRKRNPYLLRIRPYYQQMVGEIDISKFNASLNDEAVTANGGKPILQDLSHGGVRVSLIVPFGKDKKQPKQETTGVLTR